MMEGIKVSTKCEFYPLSIWSNQPFSKSSSPQPVSMTPPMLSMFYIAYVRIRDKVEAGYLPIYLALFSWHPRRQTHLENSIKKPMLRSHLVVYFMVSACPGHIFLKVNVFFVLMMAKSRPSPPSFQRKKKQQQQRKLCRLLMLRTMNDGRASTNISRRQWQKQQ